MPPTKMALRSLRRHLTTFHGYYRTASQKGTVRSIHQLRTNARRFRNALRTYAPLLDKQSIKKLNRLFQQIAREASELRDLDVYLLFLKDYQSKLRSDIQRQCIRDMITQLSQRRVREQKLVSSGLASYKNQVEPTRILTALEKRMPRIGDDIEHTMMDMFHKRVEKSTGHLLKYNVIVPYPEKKEELHEMRKCAKHLRYTLEGIKPYFDTRLQLHISRVLFFHKILGDIHDCDVWMSLLDDYRQDYKLNSDMGNSLNVLYNYLKRIRDSRYRVFVQRWHRALQNGHFDDMLEFVYAHH